MRDGEYAVVIIEDNQHPYKGLAIPLDKAVEMAKRLAKADNRRVGVYKLVQTHTFARHTCPMCEAAMAAEVSDGTP